MTNVMTDTGPPSTRLDTAGIARDRLRAIIERLPDGIVVVDHNGIILFANPAAAALFGRSAQDLVGTPFGFPVLAGETAEIEIVPRGASTVVFAELRVVAADWERRPVDLVSLRDVTDRRQAEERERQLRQEREARLAAEAANQAKSEFLAIMSHELRTPLNAVLGYAELLELGISGPITEAMRAQIGRIRMSGRHLLGLVNEILDLAKVEAGRLSVQATAASASDAVAAAVALVEPQAALAGIDLSVGEPAATPLAFIGDDERVRQILVNLLSNAVKFTRPGGKVSIAASAADSPDRDARLLPHRRYLVIRVADTGQGIPRDKLAAIFDPFVQADTGTTREREGSGLGLTISRRLARLMGGDLTVRSEDGTGSTFSLWLPADDGASGAQHAADTDSSRLLHARTEGLTEAGAAMLERVADTVARIVERIRCDSNLAVAAGLADHQIADHLASFLADAATALTIAGGDGGRASPLLSDATEIQRLIAERHGRQRAGLGWSEAALRREYMIIREEAEQVVRTVIQASTDCDAADAIALLNRFVDQAEYAAARSLMAEQRG